MNRAARLTRTALAIAAVAVASPAFAKTKIAVMDLRGSSLSSEMLASLTSLVSQTLEGLGPFAAISSQDLQQLLAMEQMKQSVGCDSDSCLAEIGAALGADYLVTGSVLLAGNVYLVQMQLVSIHEAKVAGRVAREYSGGPAGLLDELRAATKILVRELLLARSGRLMVSCSEEGATIVVDGSAVGTSPMPPFDLASGTHSVHVEKDGFIRFARDVDVAEAADTSLVATLAPSPDFRARYERGALLTRILAWSGLALGGVGLGLGGTLVGVSAAQAGDLRADIDAYAAQTLRTSREADALNARRADLGRMNTGAMVALGTGLVGAGVGIVLFLIGDAPGRYDATVTAGPAGAVLRFP